MTIRPISILAPILTATFFAGHPAVGQETRPRLPADTHERVADVGREQDEVLLTIRGAVEPTDTQWEVILSLYKDLRTGQADAFRQIRSMRGRGDRNARRAARQQMMQLLDGLNQSFLTGCRAVMTSEQRDAWDTCAADLDLRPAGMTRGRGGMNRNAGPKVGDVAPGFELTNLAGKTVTLASLRGKPVVIEFGSYTCPVFRRKVNQIEQLRREFGDRVHWVMVYTREAHPTDGRVSPANTRQGIEIVQHTSFDKRIECARLAKQKLDLKLPVLVDGYANKVTDAYGGFPNRGYVLDTEGRVVSRQVWIEMEPTRKALRATLEGGKEV